MPSFGLVLPLNSSVRSPNATMSNIPYSDETEPTYENFIAKCPMCGFKNIYNRTTDLKKRSLIDFAEVSCLNENCKQSFRFSGDIINPKYEMLFLDCYALKEEKKYSYCILNIAQAYEVFFSTFLRVQLVYIPFKEDRHHSVDELNGLLSRLYERTKNFTFSPLRNIVLNTLIHHDKPSSIKDAKLHIDALCSRQDPPSNEAISSYPDQTISGMLQRLKDSKINDLRNRVVHKEAFRPTLMQVEDALKEFSEVVSPLGWLLGIHSDDVNMY